MDTKPVQHNSADEDRNKARISHTDISKQCVRDGNKECNCDICEINKTKSD